jgi:hypothetical protein
MLDSPANNTSNSSSGETINNSNLLTNSNTSGLNSSSNGTNLNGGNSSNNATSGLNNASGQTPQVPLLKQEHLLNCLAELFYSIVTMKKKKGVVQPKKFIARLRKDNGKLHSLDYF